ncbi:BPSL0761 family protein [Luteimonas sp. A478]
MGNVWDTLVFAGVFIGGVALLAVIVAAWAFRQNRRVLADQADERVQSMLEAGEFLGELVKDDSVPESWRSRAEQLAKSYPQGDQLAVFAETLARDLRRSG